MMMKLGKKKQVTRQDRILGYESKKEGILGDFFKAVEGLKEVRLDIQNESDAIAEEQKILKEQAAVLSTKGSNISKLVSNFEKLLDV